MATRALHSLGETDRFVELVRQLKERRAEIGMHAEQFRQVRVDLAANRQHYLDLYERAPIGYLTLDDRGRVRRANRSANRFFGVEPQALCGLEFVNLLPASDAEHFRRLLQQLSANEPTRSLAVSFSRQANMGRRARLTLARTREGVLVSIQELGEMRLNVALKEREAELRAIWETVSDAIVIVDEHLRIVSSNPAAARLFGPSREQLLGRPITDYIPKFPAVATDARLELWAQSENGRAIPVEVAIAAREGPRRALLAVIVDMSERRREQAEHDEALLRFDEIAGRAEDGFYIAVAGYGESLYVSPALETIYGRPLAEYANQPWPRLDWVHWEDRFLVTQAAEAARDGLPFDVEYRIVRPTGEVRVVHDRASVLGGGRRISGILRDVTGEREMAEDLRKAQRLEAMGTLASGVAHDFNNLLMGVGGCVQLALRRLDPADPASAYLRRAADAILRGANLTRQILRIGDTRRLSDGQVVLDDVVFGARGLVESLIGETISLTIVGQAPAVRVGAEAGDIEQMLVNLASNARDAMPTGGGLVLATALEGDTVTLSVRDTGVGMSVAVKARVFEPFFTTKRLGKGTGLGLATVFALARRLGGTVALESSEGVGTTVSVVLPVAKRASQLPPPESRPPRSGGETVLLVDDDPLVRLTVENHLEALGYRALVASSAEEAVGLCEDPTFAVDLMITDVMMPGMLGPDLCRMLRERSKQFPVLFMSAHSREELVRDGHLEADARLLAKPFEAHELGEALGAALEAGRHMAVGNGRRTLVVDDDHDLAETLKELLELEEFEVRVANDPAQALALAAEFEPEIVLCDLELAAATNGYELVAELRSRPALARTYFVALTGYAPSSCRQQARESGFARVLGKPLDFAKLRHALAGPRP